MEHLITQAAVNSVSAMVSNQSAKEFESDLLLKIEEFHKNAKIRSELFYKKLVGSDNVKAVSYTHLTLPTILLV